MTRKMILALPVAALALGVVSLHAQETNYADKKPQVKQLEASTAKIAKPTAVVNDPVIAQKNGDAKKAVDVKPVKNHVVVDLNGEKIYYAEVQRVWNKLFPGEADAPKLEAFGEAVKQNIVRGIISERLMLKEAKRVNIEDSTEFKEKLEALRSQLMVQQLLQERHRDLSEENIKQRYTKFIASMGDKQEVHASHILVETEDEAKEIRKLLKGGAEFATLAMERSADRGTAAAGGDLGYFSKDQMVPEFADAAYKLKKGKISDPVESPFGWHIIKQHEKRDVPLPTMLEVRDQIEAQLYKESDQQYIIDLLEDAKVTYFNEKGERQDLPLEPPAAK